MLIKRNKQKIRTRIKNKNTSTSGGSGSTSIPYPIYPIAQQMFPTNTPPNVYNVFTKEPVRSNYEPETENVRETESRQFTSPRQTIYVPSDDGITFSENNEGRSINFNNEAPPNLTSQLVDRRTPVRLREQIREAVGELYEDDNVDKEEQTDREFSNRKGLSNRSIGQYIRRFRENYNKK